MILLLILIGISLILISAGVILFGYNQFYLVVDLDGPQEITLQYGEAYQEPGSSVSYAGTRFWREKTPLQIPVEISGVVPIDQVGSYTLTYRARKFWMEAVAERTVHVVDSEPPVITLVGGDQAPGVSTPYQEQGYRAQDNADGDLTDQVVRKEYEGEIHYTVTDASGNSTTVIRKACTFDITPPEIHLEGGESVEIAYGIPWSEPGYSAEDFVSGDLTESVSVEGEVDCWFPGIYTLTYTVSDQAENMAICTRQVTVAAAPRPTVVMPQQKTIYLTFDDGPGPYTDYLLDVLAAYNVKATFFVCGHGYAQQMQRIVNEGHSIAVHSVTHNYREIYQSEESYFADILEMQRIIEENCGVKTSLMRFPGGSSNMVSSFNPGIMTTLTEAVQDAGFQYFDWNVDSDDAGRARTPEEVYRNVTVGCTGHRVCVVLQHDIHAYSVLAVEKIIQWGRANGYQFLPLDSTSYGAHHGVNN